METAAPIDDPDSYPGSPPAGSFTLGSGSARGARFPVVAIGSNASPAQLIAKFGPDPTPALPVVAARVRGLARGFSAHVTRYGSVPATARAAPDLDAVLDVHVTLLDAGQLATMGRTEPNHRLTLLRHPDGGWLLELETGERSARCLLYRSRHGVLDLPPYADLPPQREVRRWLAPHLGTESDVDTFRTLGRRLRRDGAPSLGLISLAPVPVVPDGLDPYTL
jgi:hypothetical protein